MAAQSTNVFICPPSKTKDQQIEDVRTRILERSGLKPEWIDFIKNDPELYSSLLDAVNGLVTYYTDQEGGSCVIPVDHNNIPVLAALKYCKPADVKVIILGHDPIPKYHLATGLAFSYPRGKKESDVLEKEPGSSARIVHNALRDAKIEPGESLNHEHWAERGVLLLNACLTIDPDNKTESKTDDSGEIENPHFKHWKNFTCRLLQKLLHQNRKDAGPPIFVLCWGTHARDVRNYLEPYLQQGDTVVEYDGDHSELQQQQQQQLGPVVIASGHHPTFPYGKYGKNKFLTQAKNQFTAIKRIRQYSTLFDKDTVEELTADLDNLKTDDSTN